MTGIRNGKLTEAVLLDKVKQLSGSWASGSEPSLLPHQLPLPTSSQSRGDEWALVVVEDSWGWNATSGIRDSSKEPWPSRCTARPRCSGSGVEPVWALWE
jgi:hypothetical protein